ncbi:hypothetical protein MUP29_06695 [bacterium]|nr:hypothetical protein [bacterium]
MKKPLGKWTMKIAPVMMERVTKAQNLVATPRISPTLDTLFNRIDMDNQEDRNPLIVDAFHYYGYTQSEIGKFLGLNRSTISKIVCKTY